MSKKPSRPITVSFAGASDRERTVQFLRDLLARARAAEAARGAKKDKAA